MATKTKHHLCKQFIYKQISPRYPRVRSQRVCCQGGNDSERARARERERTWLGWSERTYPLRIFPLFENDTILCVQSSGVAGAGFGKVITIADSGFIFDKYVKSSSGRRGDAVERHRDGRSVLLIVPANKQTHTHAQTCTESIIDRLVSLKPRAALRETVIMFSTVSTRCFTSVAMWVNYYLAHQTMESVFDKSHFASLPIPRWKQTLFEQES